MSAVQIAPIAASLPAFLSSFPFSDIVVIADEHTAAACYPLVKGLLPLHELIVCPAGEEFKNLQTCQQIWEQMTARHLDRHALCINIGGGVIGDMGGFCAATYKRGISFIQIPTTLLAQVDASVGGKLGIDFQGFKNHLGVFTLPDAVLIDPVFLQTLPRRELRSGFAEIIKHCLIQDADKFAVIEENTLEEQNFESLIAHSVEIKKQIVAQDPTEKGLRKILNFGHTIGHAIETHFLDKGDKRLLHGEAIALGMVAEAFLSVKLGWLEPADFDRILRFIRRMYPELSAVQVEASYLLPLMRQDKKNQAGKINFSLLDAIGSCRYNVQVSDEQLTEAIAILAIF